MNSSSKIFLVIAFLSTTNLGCATLTKSPLAEVRINSTPENVQVLVNGFDQGITPVTVNIERNKFHNVTYIVPGYQPIHVQITPKLDIMTTIMGNLVSWNVVGVVVDLVTGHAYTLTPADIERNFEVLSRNVSLESNNRTTNLVIFTQSNWDKMTTDK